MHDPKGLMSLGCDRHGGHHPFRGILHYFNPQGIHDRVLKIKRALIRQFFFTSPIKNVFIYRNTMSASMVYAQLRGQVSFWRLTRIKTHSTLNTLNDIKGVITIINIDPKNPQPIFEQVKEGLKNLIIRGVLEPDEKIPSVREMAQILAINPNTIQRAYRELEAEGYVYQVTGKGRCV